MAGRGPAPKANKARRNAEPVALRIITAAPTEQPALPEFSVQIELDGELVSQKFSWPEQTRAWWLMWADSPLSADFISTDWSELLDTARLHAQFWNGDTRIASELRLRVAKFGATPEDRARLRIQFAAADEADEKRTQPKSSRQRRGPLTAS